VTVIPFLDYKKQVEQPVLVLAGLHQSRPPECDRQSLAAVLQNCATVLAWARSACLPVAFVRCLPPPQSISEPQAYPGWLKGFEPTRNDMVFDVTKASCYSNIEFAQAMDYSAGHFAIAGLFAETVCLATGIDAHHRNHKITYLSDAFACRSNGPVPVQAFHDAVSQVMSLYGTVMEVSRWCRSLAPNRSVRI
jgi:nicotinamidase-related amidase